MRTQMLSGANQQFVLGGFVGVSGDALQVASRVVKFPRIVVDVALRTQDIGCGSIRRRVDVSAICANAEFATMPAHTFGKEGTVAFPDERTFERNRGKDAIGEDRIADRTTGNEVVRVIGSTVAVGHDMIDRGGIKPAVEAGEVVTFEDLLSGVVGEGATSGELGATAIVVHAWRGSISLGATGVDRNSIPVFHAQLYPEFTTCPLSVIEAKTEACSAHG